GCRCGGSVAGHAGDPCGRPSQGGADLVDVEVDRGALLPVLLPRGLAEPAGGDDALALVQGLGEVAGLVAPAGAAQEQRVAVDPLPPRLVVAAWGGRDREVHARVPGGGEP